MSYAKKKAKPSKKRPPNINLHEPMNQKDSLKKQRRNWFWAATIFILSFAVIIGGVVLFTWINKPKPSTAQQPTSQPAPTSEPPATGKILSADAPTSYDTTQTLALIKQTNKNFDSPVTVGIQKQVIRYTSSDTTSSTVPIYGRVYWPQNMTGKELPVLAFAPGTTGIGDDCAASLENPAKRDWANYDSKMAAYASQGYIVVITDYEGMRDPSRIHHYMVGELEGRAVLDSVRALRNLDTTKNNVNDKAIFVGGYSQGGHAAYWANQIAPNYSPDVTLAGAIGFGPVTDVSQTLTDAITANANINWFGPFVLVSYQDWYKHNYPIDKILMPQWSQNLRTDVLRECIDTADRFWPNNIGTNRSALVYTPEFIAAAKTGNIANNPNYRQFAADMAKNITGSIQRVTPVLLNQGLHDNVILPVQSQAAFKRFCSTGNKVTYRRYDKSPYAIQAYNPTGLVDHYQTMNASFKDTLAWMNSIITGQAPPNNCK